MADPQAHLTLVPSQDVLAAVEIDSVLECAAGEVSSPKPRLLTDIVAESLGNGMVEVRSPALARAHRIYDIEWEAAKLMDGRRSVDHIAAALARAGVGATPSSIRSLIKEFEGYGIVATFDAAAPPESAAAEEMSPEERQLHDQALARLARGDNDGAANYLLAVLEINPHNHNARDVLRRITGPVERVVDPVCTPASRWRWATPVIAAAVVTVVAAAGYALSRETLAPVEKSVVPTLSSPAVPKSTELSRAWVTLSAERSSVFAPRTGVATEVAAEIGTRLELGDPIVAVVDEKAFRKLKRARRKLTKMLTACRDPLYRGVCKAEERRIRKLVGSAETSNVVAPGPGVVTGSTLLDGMRVKAGQPLIDIEHRRRLFAVVAAQDGDFKSARCKLLQPDADASCSISAFAQPGHWRLRVANDTGELVPGQRVLIALLHSEQGG